MTVARYILIPVSRQIVRVVNTNHNVGNNNQNQKVAFTDATLDRQENNT